MLNYPLFDQISMLSNQNQFGSQVSATVILQVENRKVWKPFV